MKESDFNQLVQRVVNQNNNSLGWCHKLPDPNYQEVMRGAAKRPLDLIGILYNKAFYIESKLIKGFSAFNFNRLEKHQIENLKAISNLTNGNDFIGVFVAFWEPRTRYEFMFFDFKLILFLMEKGINSILKKDLKKLRDEGYFIKIEKKHFKIELLLEKKIDEEVFQRVIN